MERVCKIAVKVLNDFNAPYIKLLMRRNRNQSKITLINWAVDYSERRLFCLWLKYCRTTYASKFALDSARQWLNGKSELQQAKENTSVP